MRLRRLPLIARVLLSVAATAFGLFLGFGLGLVLIGAVQAVFGDFPTHSLRGLLVIGSAYGVTGLVGLAALMIAWLRLFGRPD